MRPVSRDTRWELGNVGTANADGLSSLVTLLRYNACIHQCFDRRTKGAGNMVNGLASNAEIDDSSNCDATVVLLKKGKEGEESLCPGSKHTWGTAAGLERALPL